MTTVIKKHNKSHTTDLKVANDEVPVSGLTKIETGMNKIWGGFFGGSYNKLARTFLNSLREDKRLFSVSIYSMSTQLKMLTKRNLVPEAIGKKLIEALETIKKEVIEKNAKLDPSYSSVYEYIQSRLYDIVGEDAEYMKIGRSAEDQKIGDLKLWVRDCFDSLESSLQNLIAALLEKAEETVKIVMPSDMRKVDVPVSFAHILIGYVEMLSRDLDRIRSARTRMNTSPFGSISTAGTLLNVPREMIAKSLGFSGPTKNCMDTMSDRDFIIDFLSVASMCSMHLSKISEDMILWQNPSNNFISLPTDFVGQDPVLITRRDPAVLEVIRAKTGKVYGALFNVLTISKGLASGISHDFNEVMEPAFSAYDILHDSLNMMAALIANIILNRKNMKEAAQANYSTAPDLYAWLISNLGLSPKEAENKTRAILDIAIAHGKKLSLISLEDLKTVDNRITDEIYSVLIPSRTVISRRLDGGTNPVKLRKLIRAYRRILV